MFLDFFMQKLEGFEVSLVRELDVKVVDIHKINMYLLCIGSNWVTMVLACSAFMSSRRETCSMLIVYASISEFCK